MKSRYILAIVFALAIATVGVCNSNKTRLLKTSQDVPRCIPHPPENLCPVR